MSAWKTNRLRVLRAERRLTQQAIARRLRMSQAQYSNIERAEVVPTDAIQLRLVGIFGLTSPDQLLQPRHTQVAS